MWVKFESGSWEKKKKKERDREKVIGFGLHDIRYHRDIRLMSGCAVHWGWKCLSEEEEG